MWRNRSKTFRSPQLNIVTDYLIPADLFHSNLGDKLAGDRDQSGSKISYCASTPPAATKKKWYKVVEPKCRLVLMRKRIAYEKYRCTTRLKWSLKELPCSLCHPLTERNNDQCRPEPLQLISKTANDVSKVYHINNKFWKAAMVGEKQFFIPQPVNFLYGMIRQEIGISGLQWSILIFNSQGVKQLWLFSCMRTVAGRRRRYGTLLHFAPDGALKRVSKPINTPVLAGAGRCIHLGWVATFIRRVLYLSERNFTRRLGR